MEDVYERAIRLLLERHLARLGLTAKIIITREEPDEETSKTVSGPQIC